MRCQCCNRNLSNYESVLKHPETNEYLDICAKCLQDIPINPVAPENVLDDVGYEEEDFDITVEFDEDDDTND